MSENSNNSIREMAIDTAALIVLIIFIVAIVVGMIDHTYQLPIALQGLVGIIGTYFFGQRFLPKKQDGKPDENKKDGDRGDSVDNGDDCNHGGDANAGSTGIPGP